MDHNLDLLKAHKHTSTAKFLENILEYGYLPLITKPSRITKSSATLIDNIIISQGLQSDFESNILINDSSDHLPCYARLGNVFPGLKEPISIKTRKLNDENVSRIKTDLEKQDWTVLNDLNATDSFDLFHGKLIESLECHAPVRTKKILKGRIDEPWLTSGLKRSMKRQQCLYRVTLKKDCSLESLSKYKNYRNTLTKIKRHCKKEYYKDKCIEFKSNTRKLWKLVNQAIKKTKDKSGIIDCIKSGNILEYKGEVIAETLASYFANVGKNFAEKITPPNIPIQDYINKIIPSQNSMFMYPTSPTEVKKLIEELISKNSSGYDDISNRLLKSLKTILSEPLTIIFNKSLQEGKFPEAMKTADVIPLYKGKQRFLPQNYRPISLLITLSKLLEKIVYKRTYSHLEKTNQLYKSQYGFRSKHSCENAVSELIGEVIKANDKNKFTISVFLDLSKAFDTLSHDILFSKLERYGIRGNCLDWFKSYLSNRNILTKCRTSDCDELVKSKTHQVEYGTPQGSCLGPLIFLIFTNDLYLNLTHTNGILFADDTTLYYSHRNLSYAKWCIEEDLTSLIEWFCANKLTLNLDKTVAMLFHRTKSTTQLKLHVGNYDIPQVTETKFLGVWLDHKLDWNKQIGAIETKIKQNKHLLQCAKNLLDLPTKRLVYFSHIYSHLRYCILIWGNSLPDAKIEKLQKLQNKCLDIIKPLKCSNSTTSHYKSLNILRIREIINLENLKLGYKFVKNELPTKISELLTHDQNKQNLVKTHRYPTRNKNLPNKPKCTYKKYTNSFLCHWVNQYSELPVEIQNSGNIKIFVNRCKKRLLERY